MVNQKKVRLMARTEQYRRREKRGALWINRYSRGTYVLEHIVKSLIFCTVGTLCAVMMWAIYHSDELLSIYDMDIMVALGEKALAGYGIALAVTAVVSWRTYRRRYKQARSSVKRYYVMLRKLDDFYEKSRKRLTGKLPLGKDGEQ